MTFDFDIIFLDGAIARGVKCSVSGSGLDRIAPRELREWARSIFVHDGLDAALVGDRCIDDGEVRAGGGNTRACLVVGVVAVVDGILQGLDVPSGLEVSCTKQRNTWISYCLF